ncbi:unnamed protein product [Orchesella dallaii]|uniref:Structural maintenance of chromosomes protein 5 n=1 Tax=Orchesella dallaii TaxID=48710 RepID=A0ABP1PSR6_9HEXA
MATSSASLAQDIIRSQPPFGGRRGSVVRLAFKDFLSFKAVELYSGSDLNIVLGPTADEQSIIVYALCLCLGGTPTVTGLEEFIRDGSDSTSIEVELFNPEGFNFIVRRCIAKTSHFTSSEYLMRPANSLFLVPVTITEVTNLMHDLKIQLGSMNQFLSQEVLQDFVGMNSFSLLQNTQKALGNDTLYQQHEKLIELTAKLREIEGNLHTHMNHLKSRQQLTKRMENDVKNYKASEDLKAKIAELASKKSWIVYLKSREVFLNLKTELETVKKAKTLEEAKLAPIKQSLKAIDSKKTKFQAELERSKATNESFMNLVRRKVEEEFDKVETNVDEENAKLREHQNAEADRLKRVENFTVKVNACEKQLDEIRQKGDMDDTRLNAELSRLHKQLKKRDEEILEITNLDEKDESNRRYILSKIRTAETNLSQMNDLRVSRMKYLEKEVPHVYEAVQFYSKPENLVHFKGRIHEPLVLHIEVNDLEYGRIVEKHIGIAELNGFFVEHEDDLEVMLELNRKRKKRVTVTHFEGPKTVPFQRPPSQYSKEFMQ